MNGNEPADAMDAVVAASRVYRGSVMDDGKPGPLGNPEVGRIIGGVRRFLEDQEKRPRGERITQAKLARAIGEKPSTVSQVLAYKYPAARTDDYPYRKRDTILRKLDQQLSRYEKSKDAPERSGFVWTAHALEIRGLADARLLNTIRQVHDATHAPVLLLGMPALFKNLQQARADDSKGAMLFSRIGIKRDLTERCRTDGDHGEPLYSVEDIRKVFGRSKLRIASDAVRWLHALANLPDCGHLRSCNNAVRLAAHVAQQSGQDEITLTLLLQISRLLIGTEGARQLANRIKVAQKVA
ncbi:MAG TPA: hypothetical protein VM243_05725 [Phycisphaerae bacterium]|nr:hypothetical protein [Phycisphaerae bacterium]